MSLIHYATEAIEAAAADITTTATRTEENRQRSLAVVANNAENFGGRGSDAFQQTMAALNARYARAQEKLSRAGVTVRLVNEQMTEADSRAAAQYL